MSINVLGIDIGMDLQLVRILLHGSARLHIISFLTKRMTFTAKVGERGEYEHVDFSASRGCSNVLHFSNNCEQY